MVMSELFGSMVFSDRVMRERLPESTYEEFRDCCEHDRPLSLETANVIAGAMKDWAVEKGVTHFTHWFQPMTGLSAEKHDSFISPTSDGGVIMEFGGKELIKGEPDASSFPSGGLRATFEARGYTAWDPTSYAFIKDGTLCIPTAFCSYNGHALDKKTPLLRSMEAVSREGVKLLHLFGRKTEKLSSAVGPEQEYFLIDSKAFEKRRDLIYMGRTLLFMKDLDEELWKLGVLAKTKHNEVAPAQHELAPIYTTVNVATDQNQLTMEIMRKVAAKHGMTCLLHEKPFAGVNGSGKHNNWSLVTNFGHNIFEPGKSPADNAQFLLIVSLMIAAVDKHQDLLRISAASAGNDHRLGANEAPPAIVSMYLGDELTGILDAIADGRTYSKRAACQVEIGVHVLPKFAMDSTDRNRTSPLAFTGNKFEFRMLGSAFSIADTNTVLNTIMADEFRMAAEELAGAKDFNAAIKEIIRRNMKEHGRIVFNGNNYSDEWVKEAKRRGLLNLPTTVDCLALLDSPENIALFERHGVLTEAEIRSRKDILIENYSKLITIEGNTMLDMAEKDILPAVTTYEKELAETVSALAGTGIASAPQKDTLKLLAGLYSDAAKAVKSLKAALEKGKSAADWMAYGKICRDEIIPAMNALREACDGMEIRTAKKYWPFPTYGDLLFSVN